MLHSSTLYFSFFLLVRFVESKINGEEMYKELQYLEDAHK